MKIGFIGLGAMGGALCRNIVRKHDDHVYAYDIRPEALKDVCLTGATPCRSAAETAKKADLIFTMVQTSAQVLSIYEEMLPELDEEKICVDMSTIYPDRTREVFLMLKEKGTAFLDAPVVRSKGEAIMGTVGFYVGGDKDVYQKIRPILAYMGRSMIHMGDVGSGVIMNICHNVAVAQIQNAVNESLALAVSQGIDLDHFAAALSYGGGQNAYLDSRLTKLETQDFVPEYPVSQMAKAIRICQRFTDMKAMELPGMEAVRAVYEKAENAGLGGEDYAATVKVVCGMIGKDAAAPADKI